MQVSALPSVFVPLRFDSDGTCHPWKLYETGKTVYAPGKHGNGHEDFSGC